MPTTAEDKAITAAAKGDPDALPLTPKQLAAMAGNREWMVCFASMWNVIPAERSHEAEPFVASAGEPRP